MGCCEDKQLERKEQCMSSLEEKWNKKVLEKQTGAAAGVQRGFHTSIPGLFSHQNCLPPLLMLEKWENKIIAFLPALT